MKILIVSQSFYPDNFKINELIKEFAENGNEVTVLSGLGDYTTGKVHENYRFFKNRTEVYNGCTIKRVRTFSRRKGPFFRSLNYLSFAFFGSLWSWFTKQTFDIVYVYQPSPATMIFPGIIAAKRSKVPLLVYCLDIWPEALKAMSIKEESIVFKIVHRMSRYMYNQADHILVSSHSFMEYLHQYNQVPYDKMDYLPQHADVNTRQKVNEVEMEIPTAEVNFVYTGNIGYVQDVETIIRAVNEIKLDKSFLFHIVGGGSNFENCVKLSKELAVEDYIVFYGNQPVDRMPFFNDLADAFLLTLKFENKIGLTIPAKLQGYMAAGKPIIAAIDGDAKTIIEEAQCGLCVSSSDAVSLARAVEKFVYLSKEEKEALGNNSLDYFKEHFNKEKFVKVTLDKITEMVNKDEEGV
ncbi:glycosyltransferase family 4 protein [Vagococcus elongatus]|uniref:Glycosyltransferase WbuB n=1 Tax=Vagococcus elongatus TaxID=180344 RepID=A0A430B457_9ENTE|nr:glycosyltransferase family 4 protein [Vagococcus elongatus]RSU15079.1 hypothetical protein CBF29_01715 [Vagococcus elongatus]